MKLSLHTDIGLRVLVYLASHAQGKKFNIANLTLTFNVSRHHLVKIINKLGKHDYLHNVRGKGGGVYLAKQPNEINLADICLLLEHDATIIDCSTKNCPFMGNCKLKAALDQAENHFFDYLRQYNLNDLLIEKNVLPPLATSQFLK